MNTNHVFKKMARTAYSIGAILLITGLILTAFSKPVSARQIDNGYAPDPGWDKSSLVMTSLCTGNCDLITAQVQNHGSDMDGPTTYEVWFSPSRNPQQEGLSVFVGVIPALATDEYFTLTYNPILNTNPIYGGPLGNYMFRAIQRPGHPGQGDLWSSTCSIISCPLPTDTPTPIVPPTATPTETLIPNPTDTYTPTPTDTATPTSTSTSTEVLPPTETTTATSTDTPTPTSTITQIATIPNTETPTATLTDTPTPTVTNTPIATVPATETSTSTPTETPTATETNTPSATSPSTETPTITPTNTATNTETSTPTAIVPATNTSTPTIEIPGVTPTNTTTQANTPTSTQEIPGGTPTSTNTLTATDPGDPSSTPSDPGNATLTSTDPGDPTFTATNPPTLPPPPQVSTPFLIPVTGSDFLNSNFSQAINWLFNLSMVFLGLGLAFTMISKKISK